MIFARVLAEVTGFLDAREQPFALVGGHGIAAFGIIRVTVDLDLIVPAATQEELVPFMESLGYETLYRSSGYSNHLHSDPDWGRVDFVYVRGETREKIFGGTRTLEGPGGVQCRVPRPEHLAAMKVQAMKQDPSRRFQELADIAALLELPDIDRDEIRGYFERHGLLGSWNELKRAQRADDPGR